LLVFGTLKWKFFLLQSINFLDVKVTVKKTIEKLLDIDQKKKKMKKPKIENILDSIPDWFCNRNGNGIEMR
jgi:hypothetical protein